MFLRIVTTSILHILIASFAFAQETKPNPIEVVHISGNYYLLKGGGVNVGVTAGDDGILIIDDHYSTMTDNVRAALREIGSDKPEFILNTHLHGDHTGGNEAFGKNSHIIAHKNVRKRLSTQTRGGDKSLPPMPAIGLPVITFDEGLSLHFNGEEIRVMHFSKGHTDGDAIVYFTKSNVYHLSDYYFEGRFPYVDLKNGGNVANYLENVGRMIDIISDDAKIVPGHGNVTSLDELKEYHSMLKETVKLVWNKMSRHQSLEDIIEKGLPKKYKKWHWNFITEKRWIETIYESYISLVAN